MYQGNEADIYNITYVWGILQHLKEQYNVKIILQIAQIKIHFNY